MKNKILAVTAVILSIFVFYGSAPAQSDWLSYSSTATVRYIDYFDDSLQVVTSGGWLKIDPDDLGMRKISNNEGLGTNDLFCISQDADGTVWLVGAGRLIRDIDGEYKSYLFFDSEDELISLYCIADDGDQLWIGTESGLSLFSKHNDDGQIEDSYFRFGDFDPEPPIFDILLRGDSIWIATAEGVAVADRSNPDFLKSFANWKTFRPSDYGASTLDTVNSLADFQGEIYLGTAEGVYRLDYSALDTGMTAIPATQSVYIRRMISDENSLCIYGDGGYFVYDGLDIETGNITGLSDNMLVAGQMVNDVRWVGSSRSGLYYYSVDRFESYNDGGLPGNQISALDTDIDGRIFGGFAQDGLGLFTGDEWIKLDFDFLNNGVNCLLTDDDGNIWIGSWGSGASVVMNDTAINFKEDNSSLHGVFDLYTYVVVNGLDQTPDYIFMLNFAARDDNPVRVVDKNDLTRWGSFGFADGLTDVLPGSFACYDDVFIVGTADKGLFYYYFGPDPFDKSDDSIAILQESNSWLGSNEVKTVEFDPWGTLWVGTRFGLSQYDIGIDRFVNVTLPQGFGPEINRLEFDRRGNIWMGSKNGLARYDAGTGIIDVYNTLNSGLLDDYITALTVNPETNNLWIGTNMGISRLASIIGPPTDVINEVIAFPNPFVISDGNEFLSFNYDGNAVVRIYTVNGELVRETDINIPWDGKNGQNEYVASGVYLFLLTDDEGETGKGKILLIRQ